MSVGSLPKKINECTLCRLESFSKYSSVNSNLHALHGTINKKAAYTFNELLYKGIRGSGICRSCVAAEADSFPNIHLILKTFTTSLRSFAAGSERTFSAPTGGGD